MSATDVLPQKPQTIPAQPLRAQGTSDGGPYLWTCDEYHRLAAEGLFDDKRVELLDGEILRMPAQLTAHAVTVGVTRRVVEGVFGAGSDVRTQVPVTLNRHSEPEPDVLVAIGTPMDYISHHPGPGEIILLIEVSDSTLHKDRGRKAEAYAQAGIADYWVVDLVDRQLEIHRDPRPDGHYQDVQTYGPDETASPLALPNAEITVASLLPLEQQPSQ